MLQKSDIVSPIAAHDQVQKKINTRKHNRSLLLRDCFDKSINFSKNNETDYKLSNFFYFRFLEQMIFRRLLSVKTMMGYSHSNFIENRGIKTQFDFLFNSFVQVTQLRNGTLLNTSKKLNLFFPVFLQMPILFLYQSNFSKNNKMHYKLSSKDYFFNFLFKQCM